MPTVRTEDRTSIATATQPNQASRTDTNGRRHGVERESEVVGSGSGLSDLQLAFCAYGRIHAAKSRVTHRYVLAWKCSRARLGHRWPSFPPERSRFCSATSRGRPGCWTSSARRPTERRCASTAVSCARSSAGTAAMRSTTQGDAFFVAFQEAVAGAAAAREAQAALADGRVRVRMGLHTGTPLLDPPKYVGRDVHLAARVMGAGHGGQVLSDAGDTRAGGRGRARARASTA